MKTVTVIGAGYAGLAIAALLQDFGFSTNLLEAHSVVGGCASFFRRKSFTFDVGATTFSGVQSFQPVGRLFTKLKMQPKLLKLDPGMLVVMAGKEIVRKANWDEWILECEEKFGKFGQREFWKIIQEINHSAWEFLTENSSFSNSSVYEFLKLVKLKNFSKFSLFIKTFQTVKNLLKKLKIENPKFESFLQEQLLITTQSPIEKAPLLTAAMGLAYPSETYYPWGGMYKPAQEILNFFLSKGGSFYKNTEVVKIEQTSKGFEIITKNQKKFYTDIVICNLPIWNIPKLTTGKIAKFYENLSSKYFQAPAAFVIYFGVNVRSVLPTCYYQIHSSRPIPYCTANAFFVSFSHPNDKEKAPENSSAITISIHTKAEYWNNLAELDYKKQKEEVTQAILKEFDSYFKDKLGEEKYFLSSGTPKSFQDYTLRHNGFVGGIPHTIKPHFLKMPSSVSPFFGFYLVGDTVFPGQGTPAVIHSALALFEKILQRHV